MTVPIDNSLLLRHAYQMLKSDLLLPDYQHIEPSTTKLLQQLQQEIHQWNGDASVSVFETYWTSPDANYISAETTASRDRSNFTDIFLKDPYAQDKIRQLLLLRQQGPLDYRLIDKIVDVGLIDYNYNLNFPTGNNPNFYVNRLMIMIFPELFTSITDRIKLDRTAKEMGIRSERVAFERLQYQIREKIDTFVREAKLEGESDFLKRGIAWRVIDAAKTIKLNFVWECGGNLLF